MLEFCWHLHIQQSSDQLPGPWWDPVPSGKFGKLNLTIWELQTRKRRFREIWKTWWRHSPLLSFCTQAVLPWHRGYFCHIQADQLPENPLVCTACLVWKNVCWQESCILFQTFCSSVLLQECLQQVESGRSASPEWWLAVRTKGVQWGGAAISSGNVPRDKIKEGCQREIIHSCLLQAQACFLW